MINTNYKPLTELINYLELKEKILKPKPMKTAMQELHDKWGNEKEWSWEKIESWFKEAMEKEKFQIMNAHYSGWLKGRFNENNDWLSHYNETYGK